ncbi:A24 family peptidase [Desulfovirgula thermocuniculi]|uniref:A24 family peptidase n=1 Tax=Desulfovirgula thermocuniculi TaxID=348842 RepID=UPI000416484F|nr:prepilin peptidase [Desulfovirgula thermocuniculi]
MLHIEFLPDLLALALTAACLCTDLCRRRIYNAVVVPFALAGLLANLLAGGPPGALAGLAGAAGGLLLLFIPFAMRQVGAGDVKFLAALGAIKGPGFALQVFLGAALAGGVMAVCALAARGRLPGVLRALCWWLFLRLGRAPLPYPFAALDGAGSKDTLPFGAALAAGVLLAYLFPLLKG